MDWQVIFSQWQHRCPHMVHCAPGGGNKSIYSSLVSPPTWCDGSKPAKKCYPLSLGWDQLYTYTADLLCLDGCRSSDPVPSELAKVQTPLVVPEWEKALKRHPDRTYVNYIIQGLQFGYRIGYNIQAPLVPARANMQSANLHP